jgi:hypothetical protein
MEKGGLMRTIFRTLGAVCVGFLSSQPVTATIVYTSNVTVTEFSTFGVYGGGDVIFKVTSPASGCASGYWLRPSDDGFKSLFASVILAKATNSTIRVAAHDDSIWLGSSSTYCRVDYITQIAD